MYIVFEGIDCVGKTTQINTLKKTYQNALFIKEPSELELGKKIKDIILSNKISTKTELFLFLADRSQNTCEILKTNMKKKMIFSDRSFVSGIAYAKANDKNIDMRFLVKINEFAMDFIKPDIVFFLFIDKNELKKRVNTKIKDKIEQRGVQYLLDVQENIISTLKLLKIEYLKIDASLDRDIINAKIIKYLKKKRDSENKSKNGVWTLK